MVLLIPGRIREIKEEGRAAGRAKERKRVRNLVAHYKKGEISLAEFMSRLSGDVHCDGCRCFS